MSPWEEIWAQAAASFFQLWEKSCLLSILPRGGGGVGRMFNPFLRSALCKINPQRQIVPEDLGSFKQAAGGEFSEGREQVEEPGGPRGQSATQDQVST